jgi:hypothetical protein
MRLRREIIFIKKLWKDQNNRELLFIQVGETTPGSFVAEKIYESKIQVVVTKDERDSIY